MGKRLFVFIPVLLSISILKAQGEYKVFEKVEVEASTDLSLWKEHLKRKTQVADSLMRTIPAGTYTITVQFIIDKMGNVGDIKALNDPGYGLAKKAEYVILSYKGEWKPASQCGRNVKAYRKQPITFVIQ